MGTPRRAAVTRRPQLDRRVPSGPIVVQMLHRLGPLEAPERATARMATRARTTAGPSDDERWRLQEGDVAHGLLPYIGSGDFERPVCAAMLTPAPVRKFKNAVCDDTAVPVPPETALASISRAPCLALRSEDAGGIAATACMLSAEARRECPPAPAQGDEAAI